MGLFLIACLAAGCILGLMITAILANTGVAITARCSKDHFRAWRYFWLVFSVVLGVLVLVVYNYPLEQVRPGNDYNIAMKNLFIQGLAYCTVPGIAALVAGFAAKISPKS